MSTVSLPHQHGDNEEKVLACLPSVQECGQTAEMFKLISDGSRLRIFFFLCHCEECVGNIAAAMEMTDPAVSHHLRLLKKAGLIDSRRKGKEVFYRLADTQQAELLHHACDQMFTITCPNEE